MFHYTQSDFTVCKPACFSGHSDPQSSAQRKIHQIHHGSVNIWQLIYRMTNAAVTDDSTFKCKFVLGLPCTVNIKYHCCTKPSDDNQSDWSLLECIITKFILGESLKSERRWLLCKWTFHIWFYGTKAATHTWASELKFKCVCQLYEYCTEQYAPC